MTHLWDCGMLHSVYVYGQDGNCIYVKNFSEEKIDKDLLTGFFSALHMFSSQFGEKLEFIQTDKRTFVYDQAAGLIFVACVANNTDIRAVRNRLIELKDSVLQRMRRGRQVWGREARTINGTIHDSLIKKIMEPQSIPLKPSAKEKYKPIARPVYGALHSTENSALSYLFFKGVASLHDLIEYLHCSEEEATTIIQSLRQKKLVEPVYHG